MIYYAAELKKKYWYNDESNFSFGYKRSRLKNLNFRLERIEEELYANVYSAIGYNDLWLTVRFVALEFWGSWMSVEIQIMFFAKYFEPTCIVRQDVAIMLKMFFEKQHRFTAFQTLNQFLQHNWKEANLMSLHRSHKPLLKTGRNPKPLPRSFLAWANMNSLYWSLS